MEREIDLTKKYPILPESSPVKFRAWELLEDEIGDGHGRMIYSGIPIVVDSFGNIQSRMPLMQLVLDFSNGALHHDLEEWEDCIWEGDIVECFDNSALDPSWGNDRKHTGVVVRYFNHFALKSKDEIFLTNWENAENIIKIGNIYENPELI